MSYAEGWRPGEKQILITINSQEQATLISELKINYDVVSENQIRAYVIPKELAWLDNSGIAYQVEIENLKTYSQSMQQIDATWHSYQDIINLADSLEQEFPAICAKHIFGTSLGGRQLAALKISDNVSVDEPEAEVMFDGGIHGDEYPAAENVIRFARDLCIGYGTDPDITYLVDNREIWLYLMVNPDGRVSVSRYNNNGVDLNRDWAYMWDGWGGSTGPCSQVESKALRECMYNNQFVVHTTYHAGTEYISLPWSYRSSQPADWNHINQLAGIYSSSSLYSNMTYGQGNTGMYAINGSTKDSNYGIMGSISWSMEISYEKMPPTSQIILYYNRNYPAMLAMIEYAGYGLEGIVTDANTGNPVQAITFVNDYYPAFTDPEIGDYHKYVLPGTYSITVMANGYESMVIDDIVVSEGSSTITNFELLPEAGQFVYRFTSSQIPDNNEADEGLTPAVIGAPDNINYSLGKSGWCVLDMQYPVLDGPEFDIIVYEGDETPEIYTCYVGETMDGPWHTLGAGVGTSEFDIASAGIPEAQFIKILDDGDGNANSPNAGFDLDAIEALAPVSGVYLVMYEYLINDSNGNNNGRIDPGETVDIIITIKNNGNILAENTIGTFSTSSVYITVDNATANLGTLSQGQSAEATFTITANSGTLEGLAANFELDVTANEGTYNNTFSMSLPIGLIIEDWENGNFEQFEWETGGNANWTISTENAYEGTHCAKSGTIGDIQTSFLSITYDVLVDDEISFFKKISSEGSYDFLKFYINNELMDQWSGEVLWSESSYPVTLGEHTFKWEYEKDGSVASGSDCAWVDFIYLPSGALSSNLTAFISNTTQICENENVNFYDISTGNIISWDWGFEGGTPATSTSQNPVVIYSSEGIFDVSLTVSDGTETNTITIEDYITVMATPEIPAIPVGPNSVTSYPGEVSLYETTGSISAESYIWSLEPENAGEITQNGLECIVDWLDYWEGEAFIKVKATNNCGESGFSDSLQIFCTVTNVSHHLEKDIFVIPNPNSGIFSIYFNDALSKNSNLKIINNLGSIVYLHQNPAHENGILQLNLSNLESGVYFLVLISENSVVKEKIIIK